MKRRWPILTFILAGSLFFTLFARAQSDVVRIGVLSLFHPHELILRAPPASALVLHVGGKSIVLDGSSAANVARFYIVGDKVIVHIGDRTVSASEIFVTDRANGPTDFELNVPGKIWRHYRGVLELKATSPVLTPIIRMDLETAVGSVVAAESTADTPLEALKALAVAARSYFVAGKGRHHYDHGHNDDFDYCDTTHCQFLREPPGMDSAAARATTATNGLVIAYQSQPLAAMYTRSCSGRTRTPTEVGLSAGNYPYYPVDCKYCREHPSPWQSKISAANAASLHPSDETSRLQIDRRLGWSAVPSNDFVMKNEGEQIVLQGIGRGHGIGLCQMGAKAMAEEGADFREILSHYYPNTILVAHPANGHSQ
jgi:peptidoglycan hydrolase-like amidase